ncbi:MAG TPA: DUF3365 domain-containing protein [Anaeromyxobacteraceae bacterium]|nr:DUF3365 domain-containing protein [Anaeromyxobacteraceae bacterium]
MRAAVQAILPLALLPVAFLSALAAVGGQGFAPGDAPTELRPALDRAERAIRAAACDVERRFGEGDPDSNAVACAGAKPVPGVKVGRTSARLRNPKNAPPTWARATLLETDGRKAADVAAVAFDLGDRVGLLRPIEVRRRCLDCHARAEDLPEGTRDWLQRAYPHDRALGYSPGDLRGFWWAEAARR